MNCSDCAAAGQREHWGFTAGCPGCCARAAARTPHWRRVRDNGMWQDRQYRGLLGMFGLTHEQVRSAAAGDKVAFAQASGRAR